MGDVTDTSTQVGWPWVSVQLSPVAKEFLEVAAFHRGERNRSEYLRALIDLQMKEHPNWAATATERSTQDA